MIKSVSSAQTCTVHLDVVHSIKDRSVLDSIKEFNKRAATALNIKTMPLERTCP